MARHRPIIDLKDVARERCNVAFCFECNDRIESRSRHHFISCRCQAVSIDGGADGFGQRLINTEGKRSLWFVQKFKLDEYILKQFGPHWVDE